MAKLILASVLCVFLLVKGTEAEAATGTSCTSETCAATDYCEASFCKIKEAGTCASGSTNNCIAHATCPASGVTQDKCTCDDDYTVNADQTVCEAKAGTSGCGTDLPCVATATCDSDDSKCKIKEGQTCPAAGAQGDCIALSTCKGTTSPVCTCNDEHTASTDNTECVANELVGQSCLGEKTCVTTATCETVDSSTKTCKLKIGETCTASTECVSGAECPTEGTDKKCTCKAGSTPSEDKTKCGAMGIAASMLLVVATFVTSRFL